MAHKLTNRCAWACMQFMSRHQQPMYLNESCLSLARLIASGMLSREPICSSIRRTASLAPPWAGPHKAAIPEAMQAKGLAWLDPAASHVLCTLVICMPYSCAEQTTHQLCCLVSSLNTYSHGTEQRQMCGNIPATRTVDVDAFCS